MNDQLALLDDHGRSQPRRSGHPSRPDSWRLDEQTREVGRRGVAQARLALRQAAPRAA